MTDLSAKKQFEQSIINLIVDWYQDRCTEKELDGELPISADSCQWTASDALEGDVVSGNELLNIGAFLSALPMSFNSSLIQLACATAWESIDWKSVASQVNDRLTRQKSGDS